MYRPVLVNVGQQSAIVPLTRAGAPEAARDLDHQPSTLGNVSWGFLGTLLTLALWGGQVSRLVRRERCGRIEPLRAGGHGPGIEITTVRSETFERWGKTKGAAEQSLRVALRDRSRSEGDAEVTPDTRVRVLAEVWFRYLSEQDRSITTLQQYRYRLDRQILPVLGGLRVRELTPGIIDRHRRLMATRHGPAAAKTCRSIVSGLCGLATRHGTLASNPVRDAARIPQTKRQPRALTLAKARQLRAALIYDDRAVERDLPDLVSMLMATGLRIGEALALRWVDVDLTAGTLIVRGTCRHPTGLMPWQLL